MKILHYTEQFSVPSETFIIDVIRSSQRNNIIEVCTHNKLVNSKDFKVHDVSLRKKIWLYRKVIGLISKIKKRGPNTDLRKAQKVIKAFSPDIVHCHFGTSAFYFNAIQDESGLDIPQVISLHGFDVFNPDELFPGDYYTKCFSNLAKKNNVVFTTPSQYLKNVAISKMGIPPEKIKVVYNGFNANIFTPKIKSFTNEDKFLISNVSRFVHWKGQKYIIEALALLKANGITNLQANFVGYGDQLGQCQALAQSLNVTEMCIFHGAVSHQEVADIISNSHLYVHSAITADNGQTETFGVAILEAIAMGKPTIFFNAGGIPEVFSNKLSKYYIGINEKDINALADAIKKMREALQDLDKDELLNTSQQVSQQFSNKRCENQLLEIYKSLQEK